MREADLSRLGAVAIALVSPAVDLYWRFYSVEDSPTDEPEGEGAVSPSRSHGQPRLLVTLALWWLASAVVTAVIVFGVRTASVAAWIAMQIIMLLLTLGVPMAVTCTLHHCSTSVVSVYASVRQSVRRQVIISLQLCLFMLLIIPCEARASLFDSSRSTSSAFEWQRGFQWLPVVACWMIFVISGGTNVVDALAPQWPGMRTMRLWRNRIGSFAVELCTGPFVFFLAHTQFCVGPFEGRNIEGYAAFDCVSSSGSTLSRALVIGSDPRATPAGCLWTRERVALRWLGLMALLFLMLEVFRYGNTRRKSHTSRKQQVCKSMLLIVLLTCAFLHSADEFVGLLMVLSICGVAFFAAGAYWLLRSATPTVALIQASNQYRLLAAECGVVGLGFACGAIVIGLSKGGQLAAWWQALLALLLPMGVVCGATSMLSVYHLLGGGAPPSSSAEPTHLGRAGVCVAEDETGTADAGMEGASTPTRRASQRMSAHIPSSSSNANAERSARRTLSYDGEESPLPPPGTEATGEDVWHRHQLHHHDPNPMQALVGIRDEPQGNVVVAPPFPPLSHFRNPSNHGGPPALALVGELGSTSGSASDCRTSRSSSSCSSDTAQRVDHSPFVNYADAAGGDWGRMSGSEPRAASTGEVSTVATAPPPATGPVGVWNANDDTENMALYDTFGGYHPTAVGEVFNDRFVAIAKLGWGEFSIVWLARDMHHHRHRSGEFVVIKISKSADEFYSATRAEAELLRDAMLAIQEGVPAAPLGITRFIAAFEHGGVNGQHMCIVMELCGPNVLRLITGHEFRGIRLAAVKVLVRGLLVALSQLHDLAGIMHCDVKPENSVLRLPAAATMRTISEFQQRIGIPPQAMTFTDAQAAAEEASLRGECDDAELCTMFAVRLTDFGSARRIPPRIESGTGGKLTRKRSGRRDRAGAAAPPERTVSVLQTREYRAPEVVLGFPDDQLTPALDVWSVGCMAFELATGSFLFDPKGYEDDPRFAAYMEKGSFNINGCHLSLMLQLLGNFPPAMLDRATHAPLYFRPLPEGGAYAFTGVRLGKTTVKGYLLQHFPGFIAATPPDQLDQFASFLKSCLVLDPSRRATSVQLLEHPWLRTT